MERPLADSVGMSVALILSYRTPAALAVRLRNDSYSHCHPYHAVPIFMPAKDSEEGVGGKKNRAETI